MRGAPQVLFGPRRRVALIRSGWPGALAAALCVALTAACSATVPLETVPPEAAPPEAAPPEAAEPNAASVAGLSVAGSSAAESKAVASKEAELKEIERSCPDLRDWTYDGKHSVWWETFRRTTESLRDEIARRADALKAKLAMSEQNFERLQSMQLTTGAENDPTKKDPSKSTALRAAQAEIDHYRKKIDGIEAEILKQSRKEKKKSR